MKGIITKDLLGLRQVALTMGLLMVFYLFLGFMNMKDSDGGMSYFSIMALVINVMIPLTCAGSDEQCGWDQFGASLPVSKNRIVACRYIVGLLVIGFTTLLVFVANTVFSLLGGSPTGIFGYLIPIAISVFYIAVMTPIIYKFGVQKSRFIVIAFMLLPTMLLAGLAMLLGQTAEEDSALVDTMESVSSLPVVPLAVGAVVAAAAVYALSMLLSMRIYSRKEL